MSKQRQIQELDRGKLDMVSVASVRRRNGVSDGRLTARQRRRRVFLAVERHRVDPIALARQHAEDRPIPDVVADEGVQRHLVPIGETGQHGRHARPRGRKRSQMIGKEDEPRKISVEDVTLRLDDFSEHLRQERIEDDVDHVAIA